MAERNNLLYSLLRIPAVYNLVQRPFRSDEFPQTFLRVIDAKEGDRILDIGSGTSHILKHLPAGVSYVGYEPNPAYVEQARATYGNRGTFTAGYFDAAAADITEPVDVALVIAVLHHMSDLEANDLFALLARVVKPGGRVVTLDNVFIPKQNLVARLLISLDRGRNVRSADGYAALARTHFGDVRGAIHHKAMPPYTYWIMTARAPRSN